jgi:hypothetical protein
VLYQHASFCFLLGKAHLLEGGACCMRKWDYQFIAINWMVYRMILPENHHRVCHSNQARNLHSRLIITVSFWVDLARTQFCNGIQYIES